LFTNERKKTKGYTFKVKCKPIESKTNICKTYSSLEEAFEFCWSLPADGRNTFPKSTRRNVKLKKFAFGTARLKDLYNIVKTLI